MPEAVLPLAIASLAGLVVLILLGVRVYRRPVQPGLGWPAAGEIWWADVPFREVDDSKVRPCLVLRVHGGRIEVLKITSQDKRGRHDHLEIPTRHWNRSADHNSFLDMSSPFRLRPRQFRNQAGRVDDRTWRQVRNAFATDDINPFAGQRGAPRASVLAVLSSVLAFAGLCTGGVTALYGAILGHIALADIRRTGKTGDRHAVRGIVVGWIFTLVAALGWWGVLSSGGLQGRS
ncbi:DUF4190 domain-containing protein [Longispora albida]|uniref:DUF4190 domain-containing protein n=1 Tax=Longispora albida TaxID=203523 RepID=UPI0003A731F7|nr:DUF4190 domain-containing protein [Longispora albida]